jgi:hypothetical protein
VDNLPLIISTALWDKKKRVTPSHAVNYYTKVRQEARECKRRKNNSRVNRTKQYEKLLLSGREAGKKNPANWRDFVLLDSVKYRVIVQD